MNSTDLWKIPTCSLQKARQAKWRATRENNTSGSSNLVPRVSLSPPPRAREERHWLRLVTWSGWRTKTARRVVPQQNIFHRTTNTIFFGVCTVLHCDMTVMQHTQPPGPYAYGSWDVQTTWLYNYWKKFSVRWVCILLKVVEKRN